MFLYRYNTNVYNVYKIIDIKSIERAYKLFRFITNFVNNLDKIFEFTKSQTILE